MIHYGPVMVCTNEYKCISVYEHYCVGSFGGMTMFNMYLKINVGYGGFCFFVQ